MVRAAFRDPAIVTAVVVAGLGVATVGSGLAILATLIVATKSPNGLLAMAVALIILGSVITVVDLIVLVLLIRELARERRESLVLVTGDWSATYWGRTNQLVADLVLDKWSQSDFRTIGCWVDVGSWRGTLEPGLIESHMSMKNRYLVRCRGEKIEIADCITNVEINFRMSLKDGVSKTVAARVALFRIE